MRNNTITVDLETTSLCTLGGVSAGIRPGEMLVYSAGRQTGKSMLTMSVLKSRYYNTNLCKEIVLPMFSTKPKYQFSRAKWYEGKFDWRKYDEVHYWCEQNFGKHDKRPDAWSRWNHLYEDMILFRDEQDYIMFVLRWS